MSLEVRNITFKYAKKDNAVLKDFSAEFPKGKITALTGANGCGKTTLCRVIMGILKPETGAVFLEGEDISDFTLAQRGMAVGYVMQNPMKQLFCSTVSEEVGYGLKNIGLPEEEIEERSEHFLKLFGIYQYREVFPLHLSHGEKQRVALAAVLAMAPGYLLLDEPTAALDVYRKEELGQCLLKAVEKLDCGIVIISHDRKFVEEYAEAEVKMEREVCDV